MRPDVLTSAKALGGGMPIGACVTTPEAGKVLEPGDHGSTFAAGPVASGAALAVLEIVDDPALLRGVRELGTQLREGLLALDGVREVRGRGLMVGRRPGGRNRRPPRSAPLCSSAGLIVNVPESGTLRLLPPLTVDATEIERAIALIGDGLAAR